MGIRQAWWEGGLLGKGQRRVMEGYGAAELAMGDSRVSGGPCGEST